MALRVLPLTRVDGDGRDDFAAGAVGTVGVVIVFSGALPK